jgi:hypothetical protein
MQNDKKLAWPVGVNVIACLTGLAWFAILAVVFL